MVVGVLFFVFIVGVRISPVQRIRFSQLEEQYSIQMIQLMLNNPSLVAFCAKLNRLASSVEALYCYLLCAWNHSA